MSVIKACPYCGEEPIIEPWHGGKPTKVMISCQNEGNCDVLPSVTGETEQEALNKWNTRQPDPAVMRLIEAVDVLKSCGDMRGDCMKCPMMEKCPDTEDIWDNVVKALTEAKKAVGV